MKLNMIRASRGETVPSLLTSFGRSGFCQRKSLSVTWTDCMADVKPVAVAVIVTLIVPCCVLWTAVIVKFADVWLAGIVTVAGTVASLGLLLVRLTTSGWLTLEPVRIGVPVAVPPTSGIDAGLIAS